MKRPAVRSTSISRWAHCSAGGPTLSPSSQLRAYRGRVYIVLLAATFPAKFPLDLQSCRSAHRWVDDQLSWPDLCSSQTLSLFRV